MDWIIEYLEESNFVKITPTGKCSVENHRAMIESLISKRFWKPGLNTLFDQRNLDINGTNVSAMRKVSENFIRYEKEIGDGKTAVLMKSLVDFARGRQFELLTAYDVSACVKIFLNEENALDWLAS